MEPQCLEYECEPCDTFEGALAAPGASNEESKTENDEIMFQDTIKVSNEQNTPCHDFKVIKDEIDYIECEDFEVENSILKQCPNMLVDDNVPKAAHYSEMSASSSLASSSETISTLSNIVPDYIMAGCSKSNCEDSNATIKNMINCKTPVFNVDDTARKQEQKVQTSPRKQEDFMQKLLSCNTQEKKDFPKGKLYKAELMEGCANEPVDACEMDGVTPGPSGRTSSNASSIGSSGSDCTKDFTVPSTSNAEKLLGLGNHSRKAEATCSKQEVYMQDYCDEDSEEEANEEHLCTCLSSHEDDDDEEDQETDERLWRKRRYESPPVPAKKLCTDGCGGSSSAQDVAWSASLAGNMSAPANVQGPPEMKQWLNKFQTWTNGEKRLAIDALISRCDASDVRHMMKVIEPLFQRDFISLLPKELALTVLGYLQPRDLLRAAQTCRYWNVLADDNLLWKEQCRRIGIVAVRKLPSSLPRFASPWKAAYMRQYLIEDNWLHKPVDNPIVMRGHDEHVITCLQFYGNRILSGSDDTTLKVWSAVTGKCLRTLVGHSGGVWSSQMVGDLIISGSTDRTLRVWNAKSGHCLKVLAGHTSTVRCMHLHQDRVVSGSRDATLRVWSIPDGRCLRVLVGHLAAVRCVQYDGKVVVSGAYDYFVKVWNPDTGECLHTLAGHTNRVYSLQFDGVHVVSGSLDTSIRVWDAESGHLRHTLTGHQSLTSGMELHSNVLVSGNADSTVKVWDITTGHCLHTLSGTNKHQSAVTCLQSSNRFVITSSDDGTVKLWDVRTGEFIRNLVQLGSGGSGGVVWRIRASATKLICAVGSRNGTEETKLMVLDFDVPGACRRCDQ